MKLQENNSITTKDNTIVEIRTNGSQTVKYERIINAFYSWENKDAKIKVIINIDDHKPQSKIQADVWIPTQGWVPVYNVPIQATSLKDFSGYTEWAKMSSTNIDKIMNTADEILQIAKNIIF